MNGLLKKKLSPHGPVREAAHCGVERDPVGKISKTYSLLFINVRKAIKFEYELWEIFLSIVALKSPGPGTAHLQFNEFIHSWHYRH
jgi:hypothetical protein